VEPFSPIRSAFSGLGLLFGKPWVVVAWAVAAAPLAAVAVALACWLRSAPALSSHLWILIGMLVFLVGGVPAAVLDGAAFRSVLAPERSQFFYLRTGLVSLGRWVTYGIRSSAGVSPRLRWVSIPLVAGGVLLYAAAYAPDPYAGEMALAGAAALALGSALVSVRTCFAHVAVLTTSTWNAVAKSWLLTQKHVPELTLMYALVYGAWMAASAAVLLGAAALIAPGSSEPPWLVLWNALPPTSDLSDWRPLVTRSTIILTGAVTLIAVLREVICERATAEAFKAVRGERSELTLPAMLASI
jgi:hypothetical protein